MYEFNEAKFVKIQTTINSKVFQENTGRPRIIFAIGTHEGGRGVK